MILFSSFYFLQVNEVSFKPCIPGTRNLHLHVFFEVGHHGGDTHPLPGAPFHCYQTHQLFLFLPAPLHHLDLGPGPTPALAPAFDPTLLPLLLISTPDLNLSGSFSFTGSKNNSLPLNPKLYCLSSPSPPAPAPTPSPCPS